MMEHEGLARRSSWTWNPEDGAWVYRNQHPLGPDEIPARVRAVARLAVHPYQEIRLIFPETLSSRLLGALVPAPGETIVVTVIYHLTWDGSFPRVRLLEPRFLAEHFLIERWLAWLILRREPGEHQLPGVLEVQRVQEIERTWSWHPGDPPMLTQVNEVYLYRLIRGPVR